MAVGPSLGLKSSSVNRQVYDQKNHTIRYMKRDTSVNTGNASLKLNKSSSHISLDDKLKRKQILVRMWKWGNTCT